MGECHFFYPVTERSDVTDKKMTEHEVEGTEKVSLIKISPLKISWQMKTYFSSASFFLLVRSANFYIKSVFWYLIWCVFGMFLGHFKFFGFCATISSLA